MLSDFLQLAVYLGAAGLRANLFAWVGVGGLDAGIIGTAAFDPGWMKGGGEDMSCLSPTETGRQQPGNVPYHLPEPRAISP